MFCARERACGVGVCAYRASIWQQEKHAFKSLSNMRARDFMIVHVRVIRIMLFVSIAADGQRQTRWDGVRVLMLLDMMTRPLRETDDLFIA